jgi:hypothetical protein
MTKPPRGYRREVREVFVKKNSNYSESQKHAGLNSALARDKKTNDLSHALIGERVERDSAPSRVVYPNNESQKDVEPEGAAPDISQLVPLALVAAAGIAAGVAGIKIAQNRKRRRQDEAVAVSYATTTPAGWYEFGNDRTRLRYWNGLAWTEEYAQRAVTAASIPADWYPDPSNAARLRYWDGSAWTHHTAPRPGAVTTPADWYPDPSNPSQLRYWDGIAWTEHLAPRPGSGVDLQPGVMAQSNTRLMPTHEVPPFTMTTAEWRAHVEAWARAGAIQQELWSRLTNARISDADETTLAAQRQWEELTPQEGARRIQVMLEANPSLRNESVLVEFVRLYGGGQSTPQALRGDLT